MNVIVSNRRRDVFSDLNVDVLKSINGEFSADEIIQSFSNFFFNRMFLDITAIAYAPLITSIVFLTACSRSNFSAMNF